MHCAKSNVFLLFGTLWKKADVINLPKTRIVQQLKKDLKPISLTLCISKVAEEFLVNKYVKPAVLNVVDPNQYGVMPKSSTTMALISMLHHWFHETGGNGAVIRAIIFDYRKAFDLIDHSILFEKLPQLDIPRRVANWMIDFLPQILKNQIRKFHFFIVGICLCWCASATGHQTILRLKLCNNIYDTSFCIRSLVCKTLFCLPLGAQKCKINCKTRCFQALLCFHIRIF